MTEGKQRDWLHIKSPTQEEVDAASQKALEKLAQNAAAEKFESDRLKALAVIGPDNQHVSIYQYAQNNNFPDLANYISDNAHEGKTYSTLQFNEKDFRVYTNKEGVVMGVTIEYTPPESFVSNELNGKKFLHGGWASMYLDSCSGALGMLKNKERQAVTNSLIPTS